MTSTDNDNETILGMIDCAGEKSRFYALFFTTNRIVIALTVSAVKLMVEPELTCELRSVERAKQLAAMTPDAILETDKSNFFIPYDAIASIRVKKGGFFSSTFIMIVIDNKKRKFSFPKREFDQCVDVLKKVIPDKLTILV